jgi:hypothetical protein
MPSASDMNRRGSSDEGDVARRAYRRFEARGFEHGHDMDDWLEAEREEREERSRTAGATE